MVPHRESVTLSDVAREAGVSLATASRALNGSSRTVGRVLSDRVTAAAKRLNYATNAQAQAMAKGTTTMVGLLVHDITDPYFSAIAAGVSKAADDAGLLVMLSNTLGEPEQELRYLRALRTHQSRAAIIVGSRRVDRDASSPLGAEIKAYEQAGGRVVAISQALLPVDTIVIENSGGARALARELIRLGYSQFGILAGPAGLVTARDRHRGFRQAIREAELPAPTVVHGAFSRDGGYAAMAELLDQKVHLDCVFAVNDVMATGAVAACNDRGLRLPADLALAGFDDITTLRDINPPLTTVRLPLTELGARAMAMISESPSATPRRQRVKGTVVIRDSTPTNLPT